MSRIREVETNKHKQKPNQKERESKKLIPAGHLLPVLHLKMAKLHPQEVLELSDCSHGENQMTAEGVMMVLIITNP